MRERKEFRVVFKGSSPRLAEELQECFCEWWQDVEQEPPFVVITVEEEALPRVHEAVARACKVLPTLYSVTMPALSDPEYPIIVRGPAFEAEQARLCRAKSRRTPLGTFPRELVDVQRY